MDGKGMLSCETNSTQYIFVPVIVTVSETSSNETLKIHCEKILT